MNLPVPTAFRNAPPQSIDSNNIYDFGSILRMIEGIYGARGITEGTLGVADARSNTDLSAFFQGAPRSYVPVTAPWTAADILKMRGDSKAEAVPPEDDGDDD